MFVNDLSYILQLGTGLDLFMNQWTPCQSPLRDNCLESSIYTKPKSNSPQSQPFSFCHQKTFRTWIIFFSMTVCEVSEERSYLTGFSLSTVSVSIHPKTTLSSSKSLVSVFPWTLLKNNPFSSITLLFLKPLFLHYLYCHYSIDISGHLGARLLQSPS